MTKTEIAQTIIDICQNDASFCRDISGGVPETFLSEITDNMSEKDFLFSVEKYLATFKVWGHLYFYNKQYYSYIGFHVRRYENSLFVTFAEEDLPLSKGDQIVAIDGLSIEQIAAEYAVFFDSDLPDRQGDRWETVIAHADFVTVRSAMEFEYAVRTDVDRQGTEPSCAHKFLNDDCYYIKIDNFFDDQNVEAIMNFAATDIVNVGNLIIDLRNNCGGSDLVFLPLLKFMLSEHDVMCGKPVFIGEDEILYTERNADERIRYFEKYLEDTTSDEIRKYLISQIDEQRKNRGKGFVTAKQDEFLFPSSGTINPKRVVILIDYYCGSSAESLVAIASRLHKVTTIGRPTMGICDYSNLAVFDFGEYVLHYPTSRSKAIDEGNGTRGKGLEPDVYVPWTPKHIFEDVDLEVALDCLSSAGENGIK